MNIEITPIQISHIASFHKAVDTVAKERKYLPALEAPPLEGTSKFVQGNIDNNQSQMVAMHSGEVVGWCDILPRSDPVRLHVGVLGMGLLPDYRAQGLGRRLLTATLADAQRQGFRRIELKVRASNAPAIHLYEKFGFVLEGTLKDDVLVDGQLDSTHCMAFFPNTER
ncbi:MAG: N-acetyltransferase family protein [Sulfitobacter sp.]